ncbi:transglycosylase domain-containing protein, partial [Streptococcus oralis]
RFYQHPGFDIIGIGRAMVGYVVHRGNVVGGGSTLTQQLVKNSFLTNEQSLLRKFKELFIALEVEKKYSKDQILEMYLNHTYFGNGVYGVEDASLKYFGTHAADL